MDDPQFRAIVENARDAIIVLDGDGAIRYENLAVEGVLGYSRESRVGEKLVEYVHPEERPVVEEALRNGTGSGVDGLDESTEPFEYRTRTASGEWLWLESTTSVTPSEDGVNYVFHCRDVTDRKRREEELARKGSVFDTIIERLPIHLFVKDLEAEHVWISHTFVDDLDSVLGKTDMETGLSNDETAIREAYEDDLQVLETGEPIIDKEEYYEDLDQWFLTSKIPWYGPEGNLVGLIGSSREISPLKRRNEQLALLNRIVRHDIRNDVSVITGWLEHLREEIPPERTEEMDDVLRASEHVLELTYIVRDLLQMIEEGGEIEVYGVELAPILKPEVDQARGTFDEATMNLGDVPDVTVNGNAMLSSVFGNLINNAIQHNDTQTPRVWVEVDVTDSSVLVRVADDGPGIPETNREAVFGRGDKGIKSEGTGIGLYLVDTLVEAFDGDVWVEDNEPRGAVFVVELERVTESVTRDREHQSRADAD